MADFINEKEGQIDFFERFLPLINPDLTIDEILADNNDGVLNGNLLEFKQKISDLNAVLFQTIKYLSALRIKGRPIPANIIIVDFRCEYAYIYQNMRRRPRLNPYDSGGDESAFFGRPIFFGFPCFSMYLLRTSIVTPPAEAIK